eukprot:scaffold8044_cov277-Pinguiococcus_pyrenoidosus.AAC.3
MSELSDEPMRSNKMARRLSSTSASPVHRMVMMQVGVFSRSPTWRRAPTAASDGLNAHECASSFGLPSHGNPAGTGYEWVGGIAGRGLQAATEA